MADISTYTTIAGDTWDMVAFKARGSEMYMDRLMKLNIAYSEVVVFPAGIELLLPPEEISVSAKLPTWKRGGELI